MATAHTPRCWTCAVRREGAQNDYSLVSTRIQAGDGTAPYHIVLASIGYVNVINVLPSPRCWPPAVFVSVPYDSGKVRAMRTSRFGASRGHINRWGRLVLTHLMDAAVNPVIIGVVLRASLADWVNRMKMRNCKRRPQVAAPSERLRSPEQDTFIRCSHTVKSLLL